MQRTDPAASDGAPSVRMDLRCLSLLRAYLFEVLVVAAAVTATFVPLLERPGYELSVAMNAAVFLSATVLSASETRAKSAPWRTLLRLTWRIARVCVVVAAVSLLNGLRVRICTPWLGLHYWLVFTLLGAPFAASVVVVCAQLDRRWLKFSAHALIGLASLGSTLLYLATQPPIVAYDVVFGYFAGSVYDQSLVGMSGHWIFRCLTTLVALALTSAVAVGVSSRRGDDRGVLRDCVALLAVGCVVLGILTSAPRLGLLQTRASVERALGGVAQTQFFEVYYDQATFSGDRLDQMLADHDAFYVELRERWGVEPGAGVRSYVYGSREQKGRLMGGRNTLVAKIWLGEMHIVWESPGDDLLAHEMSHLFLRDAGTGPLSLSTLWGGVVPSMPMVEGAATAFDRSSSGLNHDGWSAAMDRTGELPDLVAALNPAGFWSQSSGRVYTAAGSFVRFLVRTRGTERFLQVYGRNDFKGVYGVGLDALVAEWRSWLASLEPTPAQLALVRYMFDRPTIFSTECPRHRARLLEEAAQAAEQGDSVTVVAAVERIESILGRDPTTLLQTASLLEHVDALGAAEDRWAEVCDTTDGASIAQVQRARLNLADVMWLSGDLDGARAMWAAIRAEPLDDDVFRAVRARELAFELDAGLRGAAMRYLVSSPSERWVRLVELATVWAGSGEETSAAAGVVPYLVGLALAGRSEAESVDGLLAEALKHLSDSRLRMRALVARARHLSSNGHRTACPLWQEVVEEAHPLSADAEEAEMWIFRCDSTHDAWPWSP